MRTKNDAGHVPVAAAKKFANEHGLDIIVIMAWDRATGMQHITSYGRTKEDCANAAKSCASQSQCIDGCS